MRLCYQSCTNSWKKQRVHSEQRKKKLADNCTTLGFNMEDMLDRIFGL